MLTMFAVPKPFQGHIRVIQRNAITSWTLLRPRPEIILFGDEEGIADVAEDLGVRHVSDLERNEFGTPLLGSTFERARQLSSYECLAYVNADIILLGDFAVAAERVRCWSTNFLMVGRRTDLDLLECLDFNSADWAQRLRSLALDCGKPRPSEWIDYFVFSKTFAGGVLPLAVGRTHWDNWLIWHACSSKFRVVDASEAVLAIHQNHDYLHHARGEAGVYRGEEARRNVAMIGGWWRHYTTQDATHVLSSSSISRNPRRWQAKMKRMAGRVLASTWYPLLNVTLPIRRRLHFQRRSTTNSESAGGIRGSAD